jgi:TRAP-type mannitol/chloroaromatic compound transport system permease large subunit
VFHAALLPAACVLMLWLLVAWWQGRNFKSKKSNDVVTGRQFALSFIVAAVTLLLLGGVFLGKILAVEAAATGGVALLCVSLATRALKWPQWRAVLTDTLSLSGALMALLVGATTFSLVFRLWGTDQWITETVLGSPLSPLVTAALVLMLVALCAWVLDAFEMIFVIIPIVAPPLIARLGDAQQAAVLLLLVLQLSFLIPPMGYAVMMARSRSGLVAVSTQAVLKALWPFIVVQCAVTALVFAAPWTVHQLDSPAPDASEQVVPSAQDIDQLMRDMADQAPEQDDKKP